MDNDNDGDDDALDQSDTTERTEGPTPNGGAYAVAYFSDHSGKPCPKHKAKRVEIVERASDGSDVFRTHADLT